MTDQPLRRLPVDLNELIFALDQGPDIRHYLDCETGAIIATHDDMRFGLDAILDRFEVDAPWEDVLTAIQAADVADWQREVMTEIAQVEWDDGTRFRQVIALNSRESYRLMEAFIETVEDDAIRETLWVAINGRGAFRRFKTTLTRYPEERERWFAFKDARLRERALAWLADLGIEPETG